MKKIFLCLFSILFLIMCSSNQNKFIELEDAMDILKKNDTSTQKMSYSLSDCHLFKQYDLLHTDHKEIVLTKKYKNIESLIANLDENLTNYIKDTFGIKTVIDFPVLKYENRVFVNMFFSGSSYSFIIELKEPQKAIITLIYFIWDSTAEYREIKEIDSTEIDFSIPEEPAKYDNSENSNHNLQVFIGQNLKYPETAISDTIEGTVYITFWVDTLGFTYDHKIARGIREDVDNEALRVAKLIKFYKPAKNNGNPVEDSYTSPFRFRLPDAKDLKE